MARDRGLEHLDAQWEAFCKDLNEAFRGSRNAVLKVAADEPGPWQYELSHLQWSSGEPIEIGIAVIRQQRRGDPHVN